jgi:hypothetical protein
MVARRMALTEMLNKLRTEFEYIQLPLHPSHVDMVPFIQGGFTVELRYTYIFDLTQPEAEWLRNVSELRRRNLKRTSKSGIQVQADPAYRYYDYERAGFWTNQPEVPITMRLQTQALTAAGQGMPLVALDAQGQLVGQIFMAWDKSTAYSIYSWFERGDLGTGVPTRLYWEAMRYARDYAKVRWFDFEGSVLWGVEQFYQSFGGLQRPYFKVYWARDPKRIPTNLYDYS